MFIRKIFLFLLITNGASLIAQAEFDDVETSLTESISALEAPAPVKEKTFVIQYGLGYRALFQKSVEASSYKNSETFPSFEIGALWEKWSFLLDVSQFQKETQSGNFKIQSQRFSADVWANYHVKSWGSWSPVVGVAAGVYQDKVTTELGAAHQSATGEYLGAVSAQAGVQWHFLKILYSNIDLRLSKRETSPDLEWATFTSVGFRVY
ncbi:MAG: hypothetical protein KDD34_06790 [Bdellovibrionales bacterium]|nr:hypothetical protein [Bdellovibrionales bacterium]